MKNIFVFIVMEIFITMTSAGIFAQQVVVETKSKIVTYNNQIIITKYLIIQNDSLLYKDNIGIICKIDMNEIKSISVKEGSMFFTVMGISIASGLVYGIVSSPTSLGAGIGIGLLSGVLAGLIVAPFIEKPLTLVYHIGEWKIDKYNPKKVY